MDNRVYFNKWHTPDMHGPAGISRTLLSNDPAIAGSILRPPFIPWEFRGS